MERQLEDPEVRDRCFPRRALFLVVAMVAVGCTSSSKSDGEGGSGPVPDLFACGLVPDCVQDFGHLGETLTSEMMACGAELATSGEVGSLLKKSNGFQSINDEELVVIGADGSALSQRRERCGDGSQPCDFGSWGVTQDWKRFPLMRCVIDVDPASVAGCDTGGKCSWTGETKDCVEVGVEWTCADLPAE